MRKLAFLGTRGAPDRVFGRDCRTVVIEFKAPGEHPTLQQMRRHDELRNVFGWTVMWCDNLHEARRILNLV